MANVAKHFGERDSKKGFGGAEGEPGVERQRRVSKKKWCPGS